MMGMTEHTHNARQAKRECDAQDRRNFVASMDKFELAYFAGWVSGMYPGAFDNAKAAVEKFRYSEQIMDKESAQERSQQ